MQSESPTARTARSGLPIVEPMKTIRPFEADDLATAGRLLADRHAAHRQAQPLLSTRYEDPTRAGAEIAAAWRQENASGAVAVVDGQLAGYLLGAPKPAPVWGPSIWVESAGQAVDDPETMRDLYALAATRWVDEGRTAHYVLTPGHDPALLDAWYRLGFGQQHAHGIRPVPTSAPAPPASVRLREPRRDDVDILARLDLALPEHQGRSPVFSAGTVPTYDEARAEWKDDLDGDVDGYFVAEIEDRVIGAAVGVPLEKSGSHIGPARPDNAGFLGFAAVLPEARGHGAGRALGEAVGWWAAESGFDSVVTDWRVTNLLSSRTWPRLGYETTYVRLHRLIGY
jgi:GNAT superfamily N-acetyltransferase